MSVTPTEARIEQLEAIEEDVINILKIGGNCLLEIAKDRTSSKAVDTNVHQVFLMISFLFHLVIYSNNESFFSEGYGKHQKC